MVGWPQRKRRRPLARALLPGQGQIWAKYGAGGAAPKAVHGRHGRQAALTQKEKGAGFPAPAVAIGAASGQPCCPGTFPRHRGVTEPTLFESADRATTTTKLATI